MDDLQKRLAGRIDLLLDFKISVDHTNDAIVFHYNRSLDCSITWLRHLTKPRFLQLLENAQEAYCKFNQQS